MNENAVEIINVRSGEVLHALEAERRPNAFSFSQDGTKLAVAGFDGVHVWNVEDGRMLQYFEGSTDDVRSVSFSSDGTMIAFDWIKGNHDTYVYIADVNSGELLQALYHGNGRNAVIDVQFSSCGLLLATKDTEGNTRIYKDAKAQRRFELQQMLLSLRMANREGEHGKKLPSIGSRKVYEAEDIGRKIGGYL